MSEFWVINEKPYHEYNTYKQNKKKKTRIEAQEKQTINRITISQM